MDDLKDALRKNIAYELPEMSISFEPIDMTEKIMSQGASTPIEVQVAGKNMTADMKILAHKVSSLNLRRYLTCAMCKLISL